MRKRIITDRQQEATLSDQEWLNLETLAEVEITSEDADHPIESALLPNPASGWRASVPGPQTIRFIFANPQKISQIRLIFVETEIERTQEYVLRGSSDGGKSYQEIFRQQWNFNPGGSTCETEDHHVELSAVSVLELCITPDITRESRAIASLAQLGLA